jgi:N-acetylglucosaminyldiphosphoundecaprenol N-acetyl-beta-D-mannosaminyltransferase
MGVANGTGLRPRSVTADCTCPVVDDPRVAVNGVTFALLTPASLLDRIAVMTSCPSSHVINPLDAYSTVLAQRDTRVHEALNAADINVADGMGIVWACRLMARQPVAQVAGPDFFRAAPRTCADLGIRQALVGGTPTTVARLRERMRQTVPDASVVAAYAPPFRAVSAKGVAEDLARLPELPKIVWVGLGTPKQQLWAHLAARLVGGVTFITVGAAFDYVAGTRRRAPRLLRRASLEWAYNAITQPRRRGYRETIANAIFVFEISNGLLRRRRSSSAARRADDVDNPGQKRMRFLGG